jgi:hypothetical protein
MSNKKSTKESDSKKTHKSQAENRKLQESKYSSFKLQKKIRVKGKKVASAPTLLNRSFAHLLNNKKHYGLITLIYTVLSIVFVGVLSNEEDLNLLKETFDDFLETPRGRVVTGVTMIGYIVRSVGGASNEASGLLQAMLIAIFSLAIIWSLRQLMADKKITVRDSFYKGVYPLVPFFMITLVIGLQTLPLFVGGLLYGFAVGQPFTSSNIELGFWVILATLLATLTVYMVASSIFALYVATLPNMTPMKALRSARELVRYRRLLVLRKLLFLPVALILIGIIIILPVALYLTPIAEITYLLLLMFSFPLTHTYLYLLYRELL